MKCPKHDCELKQLFTSSYCDECDRSVAKKPNRMVYGKVECGGYARDVYRGDDGTGPDVYGAPYACDTYGRPTDSKKPVSLPAGHPFGSAGDRARQAIDSFNRFLDEACGELGHGDAVR